MCAYCIVTTACRWAGPMTVLGTCFQTEWMVRDQDTAQGATPCSSAMDYTPQENSL